LRSPGWPGRKSPTGSTPTPSAIVCPPCPLFRLATLASGVFCIAASGSVSGAVPRVGFIAAAVLLITLTFRLDRVAPNNLFPPDALSLSAPIGLALWILAFHGMTQTSVSLFLPLLLQVVHGVSPFFINVLSIVISIGWSIGTFSVSGWSGARERVALLSGPVIAFTGLVLLTSFALLPGLAMLVVSAFVMGIGIGVYNVHLVARAIGRHQLALIARGGGRELAQGRRDHVRERAEGALGLVVPAHAHEMASMPVAKRLMMSFWIWVVPS